MNILNNLKSNLFYSTTLNFNTNKYNNHFFYFKKINSAYKKLFAVILTTQHSFHSTKSGSSKSQHNTASAPKEQKLKITTQHSFCSKRAEAHTHNTTQLLLQKSRSSYSQHNTASAPKEQKLKITTQHSFCSKRAEAFILTK